jgi:hypothetical protein
VYIYIYIYIHIYIERDHETAFLLLKVFCSETNKILITSVYHRSEPLFRLLNC